VTFTDALRDYIRKVLAAGGQVQERAAELARLREN